MTELCLKCGTPGGRFNNMCEPCFRTSVTPSELPSVLKMKICTSCSYMVNFNSNQRVVGWAKGIPEIVSENLSLIKDATLVDIDIDRNERDDYLMHLDVTSVVDYQGLEFQQKHASELRITYGVCNRCSRQSGNYYEAIIQVRGGKRKITDEELLYTKEFIERRIEESSAENAFITNSGPVHGGLDYTLGDKSVAKEIAKELQQHFGAHFTESFSLAGRKDGKEIYRSTYLVRFMDLRSGDFVLQSEDVYRLSKVIEKSAYITNLATGRSRSIGEKEIGRLKLAHGDVVEAVVVSADENEAQILDPVSFKTITVLTPNEGQLDPGESYSFFRYEEALYQLPK